MVKLNKIYTKTGDDGTTGLATGKRRMKFDIRVEAYGTVDECNSAIGILRLHVPSEIDSVLSRIQNELFDLGADLATPETSEKLPYEPLRIVVSQVKQLETDIDHYNATLAPLKSFILPAGSPASSYAHLARTIARRAERHMVELAQSEEVSKEALQYINRLSDFLFVLARFLNKNIGDVLWVPGGTR